MSRPDRSSSPRTGDRSRRQLIWLLALVLVFLGGVHYYLVGPISFGTAPQGPGIAGVRESGSYRQLSGLERQQLASQRESAAELARRHVGSELSGHADSDLQVLQSILDRKVLAADQTAELQALGVCLGDVLAARFDLEWIAYEDAIGRSRALRKADTEVVLFPITMISKRVEAGLEVSVQALWQEAERALSEVRPRS